MEFEITIYVENKSYRMEVKRIYQGDSIEKFEVTGGSRSIIIRNNRPALKRQRGHKKPVWLMEGDERPKNPQTFALTVLAIEKKIDEFEKEPK